MSDIYCPPPRFVLETKRLLLRRLVMGDLDCLWELYRKPEITRFIPDAPGNFEEVRKELEWHMNGHPHYPELGLWATIHKQTGKFIGRCGLLPWTIDGKKEVEVAYTLTQEFWGQGLATEAASAILSYGFEKLKLDRMICLIDPQNVASKRVAQKIGMTLEQSLDGIEGDNLPTLIYALNMK